MLRQLLVEKSKVIRETKVEFIDSKIKEQNIQLEEVYNQLVKLKHAIKIYIDNLREIRDCGRDNAFINGNISKQINIYDTNSEFSTKTDQYALSLHFDELKPILNKNMLIFEGMSKHHDNNLFYLYHLFNDIDEAISTIEHLKDFRAQCINQINSIVS